MARPKVLIVGCGAVGLSQGYHLSFNANITYLVRPGRKSAFLPPRQLYSYKDDALYKFEDYQVVENTSEVTGEAFAFILDTLDGHTARSESGTATLQAVGKLLHEPQNEASFVVYDAVGLDMEEHYTTALGISSSRLLWAGSMLAHQPTASISTPANANRELIAQAHLLFSTLPPNVGLLVCNTNPALVKKVESIYKGNGKATIQRMPGFVVSWATMVSMLHLMAWSIEGFAPWAEFRKNRELWALMVRAQTEIVSLPRFGWTGWVLSWVLGGWTADKMNAHLIEGAKPLSFNEFNRFHHGNKVLNQDLDVLRDLVKDGERAGRKMSSLKEVVKRAEERSG